MLIRTATPMNAGWAFATLAMVLCAAAQPAPGAVGPDSADSTAGADPRHLSLREAGARLPGPARQDEVAVLLSNSDALVRANMHLPLNTSWRGFVYADVGATDSQVRWQGLAGVHGGGGVDLLGGWRHVTYHFSPGKGFDSLEFNGPFLGASLAW
jgi:hypothetical protein